MLPSNINMYGLVPAIGNSGVQNGVIVTLVSLTRWTNQPAALTELLGVTNMRWKMNHLYVTRTNMYCNMTAGGFAGSTVKPQYSIDNGANWLDMDGGTGELTLSIAGTGIRSSSAVIPDALKYAGDVLCRIVGQGGNGAEDPNFNVLSWNAYVQPSYVTAAVGANAERFDHVFVQLGGQPMISNAKYIAYSTDIRALNATTWTNMPAAVTEIFGTTTNRLTLNLRGPYIGAVGFWINCTTPGSANARLALQYSINGGGTWAYFDPANSGPSTSIAATGVCQSDYVQIPAEALTTSTMIRIVGYNGNGVADPVFTHNIFGRWFTSFRYKVF